MTIPDAIKQLQADIKQPGIASDVVRQKIFEIGQAFRTAVYERQQAGAYDTCEALLADWERFLDENEGQLSPIIRGMMRCQMNETGGDVWNMRATQGYYLSSDFITTPAMFETAEGYYNRAIKSLEIVKIDPPDPKLAELRDQTLAVPRLSLGDARGMKLLTQGEFELETGDLLRAESLLGDAVKAMQTVKDEKQTSPAPTEIDLTSLHFVDFADAMLHQARSDHAVLQGDLKSAAAEQAARAEALDRCRAMHAGVSPTQSAASQYFAKRLARDSFFSRQRQNRYEQAALVQPRRLWLKPLIFIAITVACTAALLVWHSHTGQSDTVTDDLEIVAMAFVIGGVGSTMITWAQGADAILKALSSVRGGKTSPT
jgi:hypothetical protein